MFSLSSKNTFRVSSCLPLSNSFSFWHPARRWEAQLLLQIRPSSVNKDPTKLNRTRIYPSQNVKNPRGLDSSIVFRILPSEREPEMIVCQMLLPPGLRKGQVCQCMPILFSQMDLPTTVANKTYLFFSATCACASSLKISA